MSGEAFAHRFKIGRNTLYRIETGVRVPKAQTIRLLEDAGICTLKEFYQAPMDEASVGEPEDEPCGPSQVTDKQA